MGVGECKIVKDEESAGGGAKEGQIIFMRLGPVNLLPLVDNYEQDNVENMGGRLKPILKNKKEPDQKKIIKKERNIINSYVQLPCRVSYIPGRLGKVPFSNKNVIYMEYDTYLKLLSEYLPETLADNEDFKDYLRTPNLLDGFSDQFLLNLPKPRSQFYLKEFDEVLESVM